MAVGGDIDQKSGLTASAHRGAFGRCQSPIDIFDGSVSGVKLD